MKFEISLKFLLNVDEYLLKFEQLLVITIKYNHAQTLMKMLVLTAFHLRNTTLRVALHFLSHFLFTLTRSLHCSSRAISCATLSYQTLPIVYIHLF